MILFARRMNFWKAQLGHFGVLPDFLIIGAQKSGTTALYDYLSKHPMVARAKTKEAHFFDANFEKGVVWYRSHFPFRARRALGRLFGGRAFVTGEASPGYLFHPRAAERIAAIVPRARLIAILRNPIDRAFSHYHHEVRAGREQLSFEEAIESEPERLAGEVERALAGERHDWSRLARQSYLARGRYAEQLERYFARFDRAQILVLRSEDLLADPEGTLRRASGFLGLPPIEPAESVRAFPKRNAGRYEPMNPETRARLVETFRPHNRRLAEMLGVDFGWDA
jgi:hypothetical protein